jgi:acetolactate synthase-1/3 small subunit
MTSTGTAAPVDQAHRFQTIVTTVENKPGVLARVAGLFARRGFNIESLAVAPTADERFSRITFTVDVASAPLEQVVKQLDKLINVVEISELSPTESVDRELMLVTVDAAGGRRHELLELVDDFRAYVLDANQSQMMLSLAARPSRLDEFEERLRAFGIAQLQRTGRVALPSLDS